MLLLRGFLRYVSIVQPAELIAFILGLPRWVSCTDYLGVEVDFGFETIPGLIRILVAQILSLLNLPCLVLNLTLFKIFECALIHLVFVSYLLARVANIGLESAGVVRGLVRGRTD